MERPAVYSSLRRVGDFKNSARLRDHDGWVLCDGRTLAHVNYPRLFAALEITQASLQLPDGKDCLLIGAGGRLKVLERGGSNLVVLSIENLPEHDLPYVDTFAEATPAKGGLLAGVLNVFTGLTAKTADKRTGKIGSGKPVKIEPLAIGANIFIYAGSPLL